MPQHPFDQAIIADRRRDTVVPGPSNFPNTARNAAIVAASLAADARINRLTVMARIRRALAR